MAFRLERILHNFSLPRFAYIAAAQKHSGTNCMAGRRGIYGFFVFKFANEKRIMNSFFVFRFKICERKTNSFFVFRFQKYSKKNEKRIRFSFLHLGCFGRTATSGGRYKLVVSAGYFGRVLKTNSQKLHL